MNTLYVGIDVSSKNNVTYLMKPDGSKHSSFTIFNNPDGSAKIATCAVETNEKWLKYVKSKSKCFPYRIET